MARMRNIAACAAVAWLALPAAMLAQSAGGVRTISAAELAEQLAASRDVVLLDVRERDEYAISRIPGALHISSSTDRERLGRRLARIVPGKAVVVYCTLGTRSTDFTIFAEDDLKRLGARSVLVLAGGLIGWHNEQRVLVDRQGATQRIHAFNPDLLQLIKRRDLALIPTSRR